jgi:regulator of sigma E protease
MSVIIFLFILAVLVFVHELGHFLVAKFFKVRVDEFAIGFPPRIFAWKPKKSETTYAINIIPFGGYVKIFGENPDEESLNGADSSRSLVRKPKYVQALVLVAGIVFNIVFAWMLISAGFMFGMPSSVSEKYQDKVADAKVVVMSVLPDSPAKLAGIEAGDSILFLQAKDPSVEGGELQGAEVTTKNVQEFIARHGEEELTFFLKRGSENQLVKVTPKLGISGAADRPVVGISMDMVGTLKLPFFAALGEGAVLTKDLVVLTGESLIKFIKDIFVGKADLSQVSGPVGIATQVGGARELGIAYLLSFTAFISINLALLNLVPFPALDGGRILFVLIEAIKRSPIKPQVANTLNVIGFGLLILLMLVVTYRDIVKLF